LIWDPSYGKTYINLAHFETEAIAGYWTATGATGTFVYLRNRDNDPNTVEIWFA
jgi:hypothetical protein